MIKKFIAGSGTLKTPSATSVSYRLAIRHLLFVNCLAPNLNSLTVQCPMVLEVFFVKVPVLDQFVDERSEIPCLLHTTKELFDGHP